MDEVELRALASWDRRLEDVARAESLAAETRRAAMKAAKALSSMRKEIREECPVFLDDLAYRFWSKVAVIDNDLSCWEFTGSRRPVKGEEYGMFRLSPEQKHPVSAHRVAFLLAYGRFPEVGRHTCDNPPCCRPSHVLDGTHLDNMRDKSERGRAATRDQSGEKNAQAVLTDEIVIRARRLVRDGLMTHEAAASLLHVGRANLTLAVTGRTWSHLDEVEAPSPIRRGGTSLTENDVRMIRARREKGISAKLLAEQYGLSVANIYAIVNRRSWKHVV
jgi:hypothetical protein